MFNLESAVKNLGLVYDELDVLCSVSEENFENLKKKETQTLESQVEEIEAHIWEIEEFIQDIKNRLG